MRKRVVLAMALSVMFSACGGTQGENGGTQGTVSVGNGLSVAVVKVAAYLLNGGYKEYKAMHEVTGDTRAQDIVDRWEDVAEETTYNSAFNCADDAVRCVRLDNNGVVGYKPDQTFGAVDTTRYLVFNIDPDAEGPQPAASLLLMDTGKISTGADAAMGIPGPDGLDVIQENPDYVKAMYEN